MSRWLHRKLRIAIHPDRVCIGRIANDRQARPTEVRAVSVQPGTWPWDAPLVKLRQVLAEYCKPGMAATVLLSNHFARYAVLPWRDDVGSHAEQTAFAAHCFKAAYGVPATHWDIRISEGGFRRNALASAIDREWLIGLNRLFDEHGMTLASAQPWFMAACNAFRHELNRHPEGCLAVREAGRVALGIYDRFGWQSLTVRRLVDADAGSFAGVVSQELLSAGVAEIPEHFYVATIGDGECSLLKSHVGNWVSERQSRIPGLFSWHRRDGPGHAEHGRRER